MQWKVLQNHLLEQHVLSARPLLLLSPPVDHHCSPLLLLLLPLLLSGSPSFPLPLIPVQGWLLPSTYRVSNFKALALFFNLGKVPKLAQTFREDSF